MIKGILVVVKCRQNHLTFLHLFETRWTLLDVKFRELLFFSGTKHSNCPGGFSPRLS